MKHEKTDKDKDLVQPFIIVKNARKIAKNRVKTRKQSLQYPSTVKKTRKMTIEISYANSSV